MFKEICIIRGGIRRGGVILGEQENNSPDDTCTVDDNSERGDSNRNREGSISDDDDEDDCTLVATADVSLSGLEHKGGSLTSDFSPISPTSQVLIDSINRKRRRESPDAVAFTVKSAYAMTCSLAG